MQKYKRYSILLFLLFLLTFRLPIHTAMAWDNPYYDNSKTIVIGGDNNFPPYEYVDRNGVYKGFNVDIMRAISLETGVDIVIHPLPWFQAVLSLQEGKIDAIQGMKYSSSREHFFDFSNSYLISSQAIFVQSDNKYIVHIDDLDGKKVAIQKNDIAIDSLKDLPNIELIETENQEMALRKLRNGEVQAFVGNRQTGLYIVQKNNYSDRIKVVGEEILPSNYGVAVQEGNHQILEIFNQGLEKIKKNGTYDKIYKKWFGETLPVTHPYIKKALYITIGVLLLSLITIFIFYRWNDLLKKEVDKRTQALNRESTFKEQTLNSIFSALVTLDNEGNILSANEKVQLFIDSSPESLVGEHFKNTLIYEYFYEDDFYEVLKTRKEKMNIEKTLYRNNRKRIIEYNIYPLFLSDNNVYGITLTFKDITREKLMKEKLITQDKMESLGRLVAGIAHELRNPLTAVKTYIELIPYKYDKPDFRQKISEDVPNEIDRLNTIITGLLEYSKPREPQKEFLNIFETIQDTVRFFHDQLQKKQIHLILNIEPDSFIYVDKQQFKQIIINLLLNAIHAVELVKDPKIIIYTQEEYPCVCIVVKDNGCGITSENLGRIFDPFFTTKDTGTGLGLSISYQFIKENEGDVHIESHLEKGTSIYMKFPSFTRDRSVIHVQAADY